MNLKYFLLQILTISCILKGVLTDDKVYECTLENHICTFKKHVISSEDYNWKPNINELFLIDSLYFIDCEVKIVTNVFCKKVPHLKGIHLGSQKVDIIMNNAFSDCMMLTRLILDNNNIKTIHPNTFFTNSRLQLLDLSYNKMEEVKHRFDHLHHLVQLNLGHNHLKDFSPDLIKNNKRLEVLYLNSNELSDFDLMKVMEYLPNLYYFSIYDNEISCARLVEILEVLKSKSLTNRIIGKPKERKNLQQQQHTIGDGEFCYFDGDFMGAENRKIEPLDSIFSIRQSQQRIMQRIDQHEHKLRNAFEQLISNINIDMAIVCPN